MHPLIVCPMESVVYMCLYISLMAFILLIHITSLVSIVVYCYGSVCKLLCGVNGGGH